MRIASTVTLLCMHLKKMKMKKKKKKPSWPHCRSKSIDVYVESLEVGGVRALCTCQLMQMELFINGRAVALHQWLSMC